MSYLKAHRSTAGDNMQNHGQMSVSDCDKATRHHSDNYSKVRERLSERISPPPLKRQCTGSGISSPDSDRPGSTGLPIRSPTGLRDVKHRVNSPRVTKRRPLYDGNQDGRISQQSRHSCSSLAQPVNRSHESLSRRPISRHSDATLLGLPSRTDSPSKPICRVCEKSSTTNYNPIITCPGCGRPYHDSCRKPPLIDGVDLSHWRCSKCLNGHRSRRSSRFIAPLPPKVYSVLSLAGGTAANERLGTDADYKQFKSQPQTELAPVSPRNVNLSIGATRRSSHGYPDTKQGLPEVRNGHETEVSERLHSGLNRTHLHLDPLATSSDQSAPDNRVFQSSVSDGNISKRGIKPSQHANISERTEVPNTPTQRSNQLVIPSSSKRFTHNAGASVGFVSPPTKPPQSGNIASSTVLCSICQKQRVLANNSNDGVMCRNCRNRSLIVESGKLEIPETPDATLACEADDRGQRPVDPAATGPTPVPVTKQASTLWFGSQLVFSKSDIVQKKVRNDEAKSSSRLSSDNHTQNPNLQPAEWMNNVSRNPTSPAMRSSEESCTMRQMAQIALVAANGAYLTTSQIANWIASRFPRVRSGEVEWKTSLASMLSKEQEFRSQKIVEGQDKQKFWGFSNAAVRTWYEKKYATYLVEPNSRSKMSEASSATDGPSETGQVLLRPAEASQSAPSHVNAPPQMLMSASRAPSERKINSLANRCNDPLYMPFERSTLHESQGILNLNYNTKRETSFYKIFPQKRKLSIDAMNPAEKAQKMAEIKTRPSRKRFFGSDHRLAHVRRFGRQDIHDESDGAWTPGRFNGSKFEMRLDRVGRLDDSDEFPSLREILNLPENAIPMNDGRSELAFRDGTLINERLPRPRHLYKVGKLVGGEMTIRTS